MSETLATYQAPQLAASIFSTSDAFDQAQRAAKLLAASDLLPKQFQNNVPNCVVAMEMANRIGASPFAVFQNIYVIHGRPSWSAQFLIAMVNSSKRFSPLEFRMAGEGKDRSCVAVAKSLATGETVEGPPVSMAMAKAEGWIDKPGSKWQTMPEIMLRYRAASFFAKLYAPDLTMGMQTAEELADMPPERDVTPPKMSAGPALEAPAPAPAPEPKAEQPAPAQEPEAPKPDPKEALALLQKINGECKAFGISAPNIVPALKQRGLYPDGQKWTTLPADALRAILEVLPGILADMKEANTEGGQAE